MKVSVTYKQFNKELSLECDLPENSTANNLLEVFFTSHPEVENKDNYIILLNGRQVSKKQVLKEDDCLNVITILCGG